jgi:hypothetical protein
LALFSCAFFVSSTPAQPGRAGWAGNNGNHYGWSKGRHRGWNRDRDRRDFSYRYTRRYRTRTYNYPAYTYNYGNYGYSNYGYNNNGNIGSTILGYLGVGNRGYSNYGYNNGYYYGNRYISRKERRKMMKRYWKAQRKAYRRSRYW